jgi:acyl carrier protein
VKFRFHLVYAVNYVVLAGHKLNDCIEYPGCEMLAGTAISNVMTESGDTFEQVRMIIGEALELGVRTAELDVDTPLLGNLPELDSMAVVTVIAALEEHFHFVVDDEDDLAGAFETLGSLDTYVTGKTEKFPLSQCVSAY